MKPARLMKTVETGFFRKILIGLAAAFSLAIGLGWFYTFVFTDLRAHHRPTMIPMSLLAMLFSYGVAIRTLFFLILLFLFALLGTVGLAYLLAGLEKFNPFLWTTFGIGLLYLAALGPLLWHAVLD